jgi:hypothetical protein
MSDFKSSLSLDFQWANVFDPLEMIFILIYFTISIVYLDLSRNLQGANIFRNCIALEFS